MQREILEIAKRRRMKPQSLGMRGVKVKIIIRMDEKALF
jgi:hypothetical protein